MRVDGLRGTSIHRYREDGGWGTLNSGSGTYRNTFIYDPTGNRLLKNASAAITTSTYDVANQLVTSLDSSGTTTYSFDADGNQVLTIAPNGGRTTTTWDYENKTTLIQLPSGIRNTMAYDPDGLRVQLDDSTGTTRFLYDGQTYLLEANSSNVVQAVYSQESSVYGNAISQYRFDGTLWTPAYYHGDVLGSTSDLTDTGENTTDGYQYDAWGELLTRSGTTVNPFQWIGGVGYYRDPDTELYYVRARIYQPTSGRWWSVDPLNFVDGMNLYIYGSSSPVNRTDSSGLVSIECKCSVLSGGDYWVQVDATNATLEAKLSRLGGAKAIPSIFGRAPPPQVIFGGLIELEQIHQRHLRTRPCDS